MSLAQWTTENITDQTGRVILITGASSGIGKETARAFAQKNAKVIIAARNMTKGKAAADSIRKQFNAADVTVHELDLASLASVKAFAEKISHEYPRLDILIDNAGVMMCPYAKTADGFEIQFGTNHLGHFALTLRLLPLLKKTEGSRVVVVSSLGHNRGNLDFSDLNWEKRKYNTGRAYCDTKLANLYFAYELSRKLAAENSGLKVTAAHPGWTATELQRHKSIFKFLNYFMAQNAAMGALPTLRAAIDDAAAPGDYFGPSGRSELRGYPIKVASNALSHNVEAARKLWQLSEAMTGVNY
jgi:NAD(P)-dependent dehydrogenase (short-subunit alcohol dehydrogenase family)